MQAGTVHIIGAGLAGLSAAVHLTTAGRKVTLYEAGTHAGGRCRSYLDKDLGVILDNGNHLLLSCNEAALSYLDMIGAKDSLTGPEKPIYPFMDVGTGERWQITINDGLFPKWILSKTARVPDTKAFDYLKAARLLRADRWAHVTDKLDANSVLYKRLFGPLCVSIMNTKGNEASARMLGYVFAKIFGAGGQGARPLTVKEGLSESFVEPALKYIKKRNGQVQFGQRLRGLTLEHDEVKTLHFAGVDVPMQKWDWVVLALPAWVVNDILPTLPTPNEFRSIVNGHFKVDLPIKKHALTGIIGGTADWVFEKPGILSTTTSAAEHIVEKSADELAGLLWKDVAQLYGLNATDIPPHKIVKEKRATFAATPEQVIRRPKIETRHGNMVFCGDWANTGFPSTIEGSIASGRMAAACIIPPSHRA